MGRLSEARLAVTGRHGGDTVLTGVTHDSRVVLPGDLYAALSGATVHGARFFANVARAGASAVLTDEEGLALLGEDARTAGVPVAVVPAVRPVLGETAAWMYGEPAVDLLAFGVTGTNGKTTTTYLVDAGARRAGHRTALIGTVECRIGDEALPSVRTSPESTDLHALLAVARERGATVVSTEVSSHALAYGRVAGMRYDVVGFTNLTQDHLDFHGTIEEYFQTKASLFTPEYAPVGVINIDDPYGRRLYDQARHAGLRVVSCSASGQSSADWAARAVRPDSRRTEFELVGPDGLRLPAAVGLPGDFNVANAVLALAMLVEGGVDPESAISGVAEMPGVPGRMERVEAGQPYLAIVDYAHTPDAVETLLTTLRPVTTGALRVVLGCGGDRDPGKRPMMGAAAARLADEAVFTNDNPRSEDPRLILDAMVTGATRAAEAGSGAEITVEPDRATAIAMAVARSGPGDTVVVAGKGHEQGQETAGVVRPFDDRVELRRAIEATARRDDTSALAARHSREAAR